MGNKALKADVQELKRRTTDLVRTEKLLDQRGNNLQAGFRILRDQAVKQNTQINELEKSSRQDANKVEILQKKMDILEKKLEKLESIEPGYVVPDSYDEEVNDRKQENNKEEPIGQIAVEEKKAEDWEGQLDRILISLDEDSKKTDKQLVGMMLDARLLVDKADGIITQTQQVMQAQSSQMAKAQTLMDRNERFARAGNLTTGKIKGNIHGFKRDTEYPQAT